MTYVDLLGDPSSFYESSGRPSGVVKPGIVVVILGLTSGLTSYLITSQITTAVSGTVETFLWAGVGVNMVLSIASQVGMWVFVTGVFYTISWYAFDGEGDFHDLFSAVGWGFVPQIPGNLLALFFTYYTLQSVEVPESVSSLQSFAGQVQSHPLMILGSLVSLAFILWSCALWVFAVSRVRNVSLRQATLTVGAPAALFVAYRLFQITSAL